MIVQHLSYRFVASRHGLQKAGIFVWLVGLSLIAGGYWESAAEVTLRLTGILLFTGICNAIFGVLPDAEEAPDAGGSLVLSRFVRGLFLLPGIPLMIIGVVLSPLPVIYVLIFGKTVAPAKTSYRRGHPAVEISREDVFEEARLHKAVDLFDSRS